MDFKPYVQGVSAVFSSLRLGGIRRYGTRVVVWRGGREAAVTHSASGQRAVVERGGFFVSTIVPVAVSLS